MNFGQWEIGEILSCLLDKKHFAWLSSYHYCTDRAQNLPAPAPDNVLRVLHAPDFIQIGSLLVEL